MYVCILYECSVCRTYVCLDTMQNNAFVLLKINQHNQVCSAGVVHVSRLYE